MKRSPTLQSSNVPCILNLAVRAVAWFADEIINRRLISLKKEAGGKTGTDERNLG